MGNGLSRLQALAADYATRMGRLEIFHRNFPRSSFLPGDEKYFGHEFFRFFQIGKIIKRQRYLLLMVVSFIIWILIFRYVPLWGWVMAFQDYKPWLPITQQEWVGWKFFIEIFQDPVFYRAMRNTLAMSFLGFFRSEK